MIRFNRFSSFKIIIILLVILIIMTTTLQWFKRDPFISLYLMPVGEGLSLLIHDEHKHHAILYDTGNRFGAMDAGRDVILPLLKNLNIATLDTLLLSLNNQQHTGGTRTIREAFPKLNIIGPHAMQWLIPEMTLCDQYTLTTKHMQITPLPQIQSSCAYRVTFSQSIALYLISDISEKEWENLYQTMIETQTENHFTDTIILYPNQGRKAFSPDVRSLPIPHKIILFSTKKPYINPINTQDEDIENHFYNGYYGAIHIQIPQNSGNKNAKLQKLRITDYRDSLRYWWLNPRNH